MVAIASTKISQEDMTLEEMRSFSGHISQDVYDSISLESCVNVERFERACRGSVLASIDVKSLY